MVNSDTEYKTTFWVILGIALLAVGYVALLASISDDCEKRHGKLVEGVVWYECVAAAPEEP